MRSTRGGFVESVSVWVAGRTGGNVTCVSHSRLVLPWILSLSKGIRVQMRFEEATPISLTARWKEAH